MLQIQMLVFIHAKFMETDAKLWLGVAQRIAAGVTTNTLEVALYITNGQLTILLLKMPAKELQTRFNLSQFAEVGIQLEVRIA